MRACAILMLVACCGTAPAADAGRPSGLPLPGSMPVAEFEAKLFPFLNDRQYEALGWVRDKGVRDTGPYIDGKYYGTHPAVRVFYSPGVIRWLENGRAGAIPDGEMIIKEQYAAPAARHDGKTEAELRESLEAWTVMVKDASGSQDGWFWSNPGKGQKVVDNHRDPFPEPISGFGQYCVRCHAAPQTPGEAASSKANEFTFVSLRNVAGYPGEPIRFRVDDSWREPKPKAAVAETTSESHPQCPRTGTADRPCREPDPRFLLSYTTIPKTELAAIKLLPPVTHDWAVTTRDPSREFVTSNQCMSCHAGLVAPFGPSMYVPFDAKAEFGGPGRDVSPHGEWRWTPMGLAGRDPVFLAQVESEVATIRKEFRADPKLAAELESTLADTCLRCHGAMGQRQHQIDHAGRPDRFSLDLAHGVEGPHARYGALARDGVGCMVCHRMQPRPQAADDSRSPIQHFLETSTTGNFHLGPKGDLFGPYRDDAIAPYAMEHATGWKPKHGAFLQSSQMCGTCHTVALPNVDRPFGDGSQEWKPDELTRSETVPLFRKFHHHVEQATYLEWLNSEYENEVDPANPRARSCQDCHMPRGVTDEAHGIAIPRLKTRIATIQDTTYPDAENLAPGDQLRVRIRDEEGYRRHSFAGLNAFLLTLFDQFDDVLGVRKADTMTGSREGLAQAVQDMARTARNDVASLDLDASWQGSHRLNARVTVRNKVGHRFPSGVGFRRAFLELSVIQAAGPRTGPERIVWSSGRTDGLGQILGANGRPLPSESFAAAPADGHQSYQPHHDVITSPDQAQVYESLLRDAKGRFTTSFIHGCEVAKDNRLLPRGWKPDGPGAKPVLTGRYLKATHPSPDVAADPRYGDGSGSDEVAYRIDLPADVDPSRLIVRATLYYQALPPYFLRNLFETAPDGPSTRRLHHMISRLDLKGTPIESWKLPITSATATPGPRPLADARLHRVDE
ncbi:hypothetical protein TA3x_002104 [Tundrisphaera sp. TA3]|uniref:hypothetical protein n=1 Tax=Tundrisphaera sp. TA3 TaxID=3435775 RepID=UPI003EC124B4